MEGHDAARESVVHAVKCIEITHLQNHEALGRGAMLERPGDEGMSHLCGAKPDRQIGSSDCVEWLAAPADLSIDGGGDGPRWNRTISFEVITLDGLPGPLRSIGGAGRY